MKVPVTGGGGFIGKHLVKFFLEKKYSVTIFDNFSNSTKESISHIIQIWIKRIEGNIRYSYTDISKAKKELSYSLKIKLDKIKELIE